MNYEKFAQLLVRDKVTAYQVAQLTKIPASTFSDWKTGKSKPKIDKIQRIAKYFKVSIEYFLQDSEKD